MSLQYSYRQPCNLKGARVVEDPNRICHRYRLYRVTNHSGRRGLNVAYLVDF